MNVAKAFRSVLYMPANNERAIKKAPTLDADAVILDLEDAVAPDEKSNARTRACDALTADALSGVPSIVRVNALDTPWGEADLAAAVCAMPHAVLIPKVSTRALLDEIVAKLDLLDSARRVHLWLMIETPLAVLNVASIASEASESNARLECLVMGTNDLAKETGASMESERFAMLGWLSQCVAAASAYGLTILDGVYNRYADEDGFARECRQGRELGMDGKTLIHPVQIAQCNDIFSPSEREIAWARRVVQAFGQPENASVNVLAIDGQMVERLHAEMAKALLERC